MVPELPAVPVHKLYSPIFWSHIFRHTHTHFAREAWDENRTSEPQNPTIWSTSHLSKVQHGNMHRWTQSKHRKCVMGRTNCSFTQPTIVHCFDVGHLHCQPLSDLVFLEVYLACVVFQTLRWQVHNAVTWSGIKAKCESLSHSLSCSSNWRGSIHKEIVHSRQTVRELQKTPRQWSLPRIRLYFVLVLSNKTQ